MDTIIIHSIDDKSFVPPICVYDAFVAITHFDLDVDIVFRDKNPDVPNPMGKTITINLVPGNEGSPIIEEN